jgi:hypothetical protein
MIKYLLAGTVLACLTCSTNRVSTNQVDGGGTGGGQGGTGSSPGGTGGSPGSPGGTGGNPGGTAGRTVGTGGRIAGGTGGGGGTSISPGGSSVLERNNHPSRDGHFLQPTLTKVRAATLTRDTAFVGAFAGSMWASPLYLENGPGGRGTFFAVTTGNDVVALDENTGTPVWPAHNIGASPMANGTQPNGNPVCGSIHPLGIISTPVIDPQSRTIYVAGAIGSTSILRHEVHALSVDDGSERSGWPVNVSAATAGSVAFGPITMYQNQRSALSLVNGILYVAYGGHVGDCGPYHGWVIAINTANPTPTMGAWASGGVGEAIWAAGGMASDGNGVFAMTGNSTTGTATHFDSEEVVRITGLGTVNRTNANLFFPATWRAMDNTDADLGSNSPMVIEVPGATPPTYVVAISKDGHLFLLNSTNLGGMGGQVVDFPVASSAGMNIHTVPAAYTTAAGVHVTFSTDAGAMCPPGGPTGRVIMSVLIPPGAPPVPRVVWCAALTGSVTSPIATTIDGRSDAMVWYMSGNRLVGVDGDTGAVVVQSADTCTAIRQWTSPIAVKGHIIAGGDGHLCSWSPR